MKPEDKGEFNAGARDNLKPEDKGDLKPEDKGFGGLLGRSNGSSGGGGFVVVSFIGAAGLDVRNLAAGILFGNELRRPRIKRLGNVATEALQQARKEKLARVDAAKDISKIVEKQVKAELEALGAASIIEIAAALINEKSAVESNGKSTTPGNGKSAAKFKKTGAATPTSPKLAAMKST